MTRSPDEPPDGSVGNAREAALHAAYADHSRAVFGLAYRMCGPGLAEDVTQEVFLRFWQAPERFDSSRGSMRAFLLTMTHHRAVDLLRSGESRRRREQGSTPTETSTGDDVELRVESRDTAERLRGALAALPALERTAIVVAFYGGCSYREAAHVLGEAEGTVKSRIRSGLRRLSAAGREFSSSAVS